MGEKGRRRAIEIFDWSKVIVHYQELWDELDAIRKRDGASHRVRGVRASRLNPHYAFKEYPTYTGPGPEHFREVLVHPDAFNLVEQRRKLGIIAFAEEALPDTNVTTAILNYLRNGGDVRHVRDCVPGARQGDVVWLHKLGILEFR